MDDLRDTQYNLPIGTDTISRQAAIDYFVINVGFHDEDGYPIEDTDELRKIWTGCFDGIPPVEPEKRTEERTETRACDSISRQAAIDALHAHLMYRMGTESNKKRLDEWINSLPPAQPEPKRGKWILDRSGAYCCSECMEPCAGYVMMKPRDKFCKMCGSRNEVTE